MRKVIPKNIADEMTKPYIDDAVEKQIEAADVPPRNKLNISFENAGRIDDNKEYKSNQEAYEKNHGKLYDMTHKNTIPWKNYVVYLVLLSLLTTVFTFSKYMSGINANSAAAVAKFNVQTSGAINSDNFTIVPVTDDKANASIYFNENDTSGQTIKIKVLSYSEVPVKVTISQTNTNFTGSFNNTTFDLGISNGTVATEGTVTYAMDVPSISSGATKDKDGYYDLGNLVFNVSIEQID